MAKKSTTNNDGRVTIALTEPYRLYVKYAPKTLIPCCAVDHRWKQVRPNTQADWKAWLGAKFITNDEQYVHAEFISCYNNCDGRFNDRFEDMCQELFGMPYATILSIWRSRFPRMDGYWYIVKLTKI